jgi:lysozyme
VFQHEMIDIPPSTRRLAALAAVALACLLAPVAAQAQRVPGIDVSRFQGVIDWTAVAASGEAEFAYIQASRGSGADCAVAPDRCGPDEFYDRNYLFARAAGILVGPYHRAFTGGHGTRAVRVDARREARVFLASVGEDLRPGDLRPVLDVETPFNDQTAEELQRWIRTWLIKVEKKTGTKPIIYTNYSSWGVTGQATKFALRGYPLWVANFDVERPLVPAQNWAGLGWSIWQYTSRGQVPGIAGNVDQNWARVPFESISVGGG